MKKYFLIFMSLVILYKSFGQLSIKELETNTFKIKVFKKGELIKTGSGVVGFTTIKNGVEEIECFTNAHVLDGGDSALAIFKEEIIPILNLCAINYEMDYAFFDLSKSLIKRNGLLKKAELKSFDKELEKGNKVYTMSSPRGLEYTYTDGVISSTRNEKSYTLIQFTCPISPGSSGGALVNQQGVLIGIITSQFIQSQNLNFAISINDILASIRETDDLKLKLSMLENFKINSDPTFKRIHDLLKANNEDEAYKLMLSNYEPVSKSWGLMFIKLKYEQDRKLYNSYIETLKDFSQIHGFQTILYWSLVSFFYDLPKINHSDLISLERKFKVLYEINSDEIIFEAILGYMNYIISDYNTAISHLTRFTTFYSDKKDKDFTLKNLNHNDASNTFLLSICFELLGDSWMQTNNLNLATEAYLNSTTRAYSELVFFAESKGLSIENLRVEDKKDLWRRGIKAINAYSKNNQIEMTCFIYNKMLIEIDPKGKESELYKSCR